MEIENLDPQQRKHVEFADDAPARLQRPKTAGVRRAGPSLKAFDSAASSGINI